MNDDYLPADGQVCEICSEPGHCWCTPFRPGPDIEHLAVELANIEKRAA